MLKRRDIPVLRWTLYVFATLQFVRFYVVSTRFYLNMPAYMAGRERLPFQERVLPILLMWPINHWHALMQAVATRGNDPQTSSASGPKTIAFYFVSLLGFSVASVFTIKLYRAVTKTGTLSVLIFPVFLVISMWTYVVHIDANYSYPYDMPSLAFFTAGLYFIYKREFLPLVVTMLFGTFNRETTLFLIGIYALDAASVTAASVEAHLMERFHPRLIPWGRVAGLFALWLAIKVGLTLEFAHNSNAENYNRTIENLYRLKLRLLPSLLNICAYMLPVVWIFRRRVAPVRFANYVYIFPVWLAIMFYTGVILETRIYGELSAYVAVCVVLLLEEHVRQPQRESIEAAEELVIPRTTIPEAVLVEPELVRYSAKSA